jgi:hypothetical protein
VHQSPTSKSSEGSNASMVAGSGLSNAPDHQLMNGSNDSDIAEDIGIGSDTAWRRGPNGSRARGRLGMLWESASDSRRLRVFDIGAVGATSEEVLEGM